MKRINTIALPLLVSLLSLSAHAEDGKFSLLRCGLQWGGSSSTEAKAYTAARRTQKYDTQRAFDSFDSNRPGAHTPVKNISEKNDRGQLPRTFTLAKVGCTWR